MLNEGYALFKSLEQCGIVLTKRHPDIKKPGKREGLIIGLNKEGRVERIEYRNKEEVSRLWTTREGNHNSFPVLKLQRPIWKVNKEDMLRKNLDNLKKDEIKKREIIIRENRELNITEIEINWWERLKDRVAKIRPFFTTSDKEYQALPELMNRFLNSNINDFINDLSIKLRRKDIEIPYSLLENMLIGNKWDNKKQEYVAETPLILEVSDWENFSIRVASPKFEYFASMCLFKIQDNSANQENIHNKGQSALSGEVTILEDDKFPNPKLPVIGNTYLFSVNDQTPCQTRYKKSSTEIIPIGRKEANAIQDSLNWITENSRKGKTWYPVPGLNDKKDLLIAYIVSKPDINVNKAHLLGGVSKNQFSESNYEATAKAVFDALKGKDVIRANDLIRIFALRKADPGRTQVSFQRIYSISELIQADELWRISAKNHPNYYLPFSRKEIESIITKQNIKSESISHFLNKKESNAVFLSPWCPFPADLVQITLKQWTKFGRRTNSINGISLGDVYDVFFDIRNQRTQLTNNLLTITLQRTQSLLLGLGNADHKSGISIFYSETKSKSLESEAKFTALKAVSILSIYLYKLGIKKEYYMNDIFFNIGRFLSLVDTLHFEWCKCVRGGYPEKSEKEWRKAIPPQLLGSAHLTIALDNPVSAFDILSRRINVYKDWTRKESGEKVKLARWAVGEIGKISDLLAKKNLPTCTTSIERVQILLGYLAKPEKKNDPEIFEDQLSENN
ncbi:hypothetical protein [Melioribacter sp. OK-6-Me]|uniref:hypothetical protein n=1 Tax=unclassified Melioribacter TaxID=2627329 RepID=UPI003EDAB84D